MSNAYTTTAALEATRELYTTLAAEQAVAAQVSRLAFELETVLEGAEVVTRRTAILIPANGEAARVVNPAAGQPYGDDQIRAELGLAAGDDIRWVHSRRWVHAGRVVITKSSEVIMAGGAVLNERASVIMGRPVHGDVLVVPGDSRRF